MQCVVSAYVRVVSALALLCLFQTGGSACLAETQGFVQSRLEEVRAEVAGQEQALELARKKEVQLKQLLERLSQELNNLQNQEHELSEELDRLSEQMQTVSERIASLVEDDKRLQELSRKRLRYVFVQQDMQAFQKLVLGASDASFGRNLYLISQVRDYDLGVLNEWRNVRLEYEQREQEYKQLREQKVRVRDSISNKRETLARTVVEKQKAAADLKKEQRTISDSLVALETQALRIETVVQSLTTTGEDSTNRSAQSENREESEPAELEAREGQGLESLRGKLPSPVEGEITRSFGRQRRKEFSDFVMSKGLEFLVEAGAEVRAVAAGQAIYVGTMPGFGEIVLLHHGKRYYSLYGRLFKPRVKAGDSVAQGDALAKTGEIADGIGNFYFEIRQNGQPVDPAGYLKNAD